MLIKALPLQDGRKRDSGTFRIWSCRLLRRQALHGNHNYPGRPGSKITFPDFSCVCPHKAFLHHAFLQLKLAAVGGHLLLLPLPLQPSVSNVQIAKGLIGPLALERSRKRINQFFLRLRNPAIQNKLPYTFQIFPCLRINSVHMAAVPEAVQIQLYTLISASAVNHGSLAPIPYRISFQPFSGRRIFPEYSPVLVLHHAVLLLCLFPFHSRILMLSLYLSAHNFFRILSAVFLSFMSHFYKSD